MTHTPLLIYVIIGSGNGLSSVWLEAITRKKNLAHDTKFDEYASKIADRRLFVTWSLIHDYNMTVWILAGNYISFTIAAGLIRLHMPGVKKSRV